MLPVKFKAASLPLGLGDLKDSYLYKGLVAQMVKRLPAIRETQVQSLGWEDLLEKAMATHSSIGNGLPLKIPWMKEPGRLPSMRSQRVGHD